MKTFTNGFMIALLGSFLSGCGMATNDGSGLDTGLKPSDGREVVSGWVVDVDADGNETWIQTWIADGVGPSSARALREALHQDGQVSVRATEMELCNGNWYSYGDGLHLGCVGRNGTECTWTCPKAKKGSMSLPDD